MNEGGCDPDGRFYCGSMDVDARPGRGSLYRLDADLTVETVLTGLRIFNGLEWTPAGNRAYYVDTPTRRIDIFDYSTSQGVTNRRPFVVIPAEHGSPDGLTVDSEGGVWVALWDGSAVHRYTPAGRLDLIVDVGARQVSACCFGGADLSELLITTSRAGLDPDDDPVAGALFVVRPGHTGQPVRAFAN